MPEPYHLGEHIIASSSKLIAIDKLLADILPTGERVLIFSVRSSQVILLISVLNKSYPSNGLGAIKISLFFFALAHIVPAECSTYWRTSSHAAQFHMQD
jgi:hypothetical protein